MRITLTIERDVERLVQREMRRSGKSMNTVVNEALRTGFREPDKCASAGRFQIEPHAFGFKPGIDTHRLNQLADKLEGREAARRLDR